jgi:elongation factor Ts
MPEITAAAVKALREKTGLPMMDCKRALTEADGDPEAAIEALRKAGKKTMEKRGGRETSAGRIAMVAGLDPGIGALVELRCESAPVANNEEFTALARDLAQQLAFGPGATTPEQLLAQSSPGKPGQTLQQQFDDLTNRIREVFRVARICRIDAPCGGYAHHNGGSGVLLEVQGGSAELAKDICMHVAAMRPSVVSRADVDPALVEKEREIAATAARNEGKPEKIIPKIAEGKLKDFYAQQCLAEQIHPNKEKYGGQTVGKLAEAAGMKLVRFVH